MGFLFDMTIVVASGLFLLYEKDRADKKIHLIIIGCVSLNTLLELKCSKI